MRVTEEALQICNMASYRGREKVFVAVKIWEFEYLLAESLLRGLRGVKAKDSKPGEKKSAD